MITYGIHAKADINSSAFSYKTSLIGDFNKYNILAAVATCRTLGIQDNIIKKGIETFITPIGRMTKIKNSKGLFLVVDYAHTPNGLEQALTALQAEKKNGRIISLIGAEGKRDPGKREKMGEIAAKFSDIVVITSVDPRGEADKINAKILEGAEKNGKKLGKTVFIEPDRKKAIRLAILNLAKKDDLVGIFGKGHERSINYDGKKEEEWSDIKEVEIALEIKK